MSNALTILKSMLILGLLSTSSACFEELNGDASVNKFAKSFSDYRLEEFFPGQVFRKPIAMLPHPQIPGLWYIVEKEGNIVILNKNSAAVEKTLFADISGIVDASDSEGGLLGMAFHPDFQNNGYVFVSYTRSGNGKFSLISTVSRFYSPDKGQSLDNKSEKQIFNLNQPYSNHNGGNIAFDRLGYLMIGFGDGGSAGDPAEHGQNPQSFLGKLLRIDVNTKNSYHIPPENPFVGNRQFRPEIYAWGLRNPWRWSFDKKTGELWLGDVGQNKWEEIDIIKAGGNYGWNLMEGNHCYKSRNCKSGTSIPPVYEYNHDDGCSVTGGYVYRGTQLADLEGRYIFGDFCSGKIWILESRTSGKYTRKLLIDSGLNIASFAEGNDGEIYVIHFGGQIYALMLEN